MQVVGRDREFANGPLDASPRLQRIRVPELSRHAVDVVWCRAQGDIGGLNVREPGKARGVCRHHNRRHAADSLELDLIDWIQHVLLGVQAERGPQDGR